MIDNNNLDGILKALDRQIGARDGKRISLVVCGGSALFALGLIVRTTKDVDILGEAFETGQGIEIAKLDPFPNWLSEAAAAVQRDFGLPENWLNTGPASQIDSGLPEGFHERLTKKCYGDYLAVYFIGRLDQIHFKLMASVDRVDYQVDDLLALKPTSDEMHLAVEWALTQDVSEGFRIILKDFLSKKGYSDVSERI
jgi:hypothetical protein